MSGWLDKLKDYAPSIAAAVFSGGATLPQLAAKMIGDATGVKVSTLADAEKVINAATPDQLLAIKKVDNQHAVEMSRIEIGDIQNARSENKHSIMPALICCYLTVAVTGFVVGLMTLEIPEGNVRLIDMMFGSVLTAWLSSVAYWVGTTRSSAEKSKGVMK
jgi:hypothetical protein